MYERMVFVFMAMNNYFDFAQNDYEYLQNSYKCGLIANAMAASAQNICEKYIKGVIDQFYEPGSQEDCDELERIMRTHSLNRLMQFLKNNMQINLTTDTNILLRQIDGYYFSTRYPGDNSIEVDKTDIELCIKAATACRNEILEIREHFLQNVMEPDFENDER